MDPNRQLAIDLLLAQPDPREVVRFLCTRLDTQRLLLATRRFLRGKLQELWAETEKLRAKNQELRARLAERDAEDAAVAREGGVGTEFVRELRDSLERATVKVVPLDSGRTCWVGQRPEDQRLLLEHWGQPHFPSPDEAAVVSRLSGAGYRMEKIDEGHAS